MKEQPRILSFRIQRRKYPSERVEQYIIYNGDKIELTDEQVNSVLPLIPPVWNTDKDKLTNFVLFEDGTFMCTRSKEVYNYSLKDTQEKTYFFSAATKEQVKEIVDVVIHYYNSVKLSNVDNFYDTIINSLADVSYIKSKILEMRKNALEATDYMFNSDYVFKTETDKQEIITYRQEWRDITETEAWKNNEIDKLLIPVHPLQVVNLDSISKLLDKNLTSVTITPDIINSTFDTEEYKNVMKNFTSTLFKLNILKTLSSLELPLGYQYQDIDEIENSIKATIVPLENFYRSLPENENIQTQEDFVTLWKKQISGINEKLSLLNQHFKTHNFDFTVSDILDKMVENANNAAKEEENMEDVNNLLRDIELDGGLL